MNKTIFFAVPIRNREWVVDEYLAGLLGLDYPKELIQVYFLVNDCADNTYKKIMSFRDYLEDQNILKEYKDFFIEYRSYGKIETIENGKIRTNKTISMYPHFAMLKNHVKEMFLKSGCDYWFQIDSDSPPEPNTLNKLLRHQKDYVAGVCECDWMCWEPNSLNKLNIMKFKNNRPRTHLMFNRVNYNEINECPDGKLLECDWAGGVVLMSRKIAQDCDYHIINHKNDDTLGFCVEAKEKGYKIYFDPNAIVKHYLDRNKYPDDPAKKYWNRW